MFISNRAMAGDGGALWTDVFRLNISSCVFQNNSAGARGGAVAYSNSNCLDSTSFEKFILKDVMTSRIT